MLYENILDMVGDTPLVKLNKVVSENMADVYVKLEKYNPGGSVKDRAALGMIEAAEKSKTLKKGSTIIEPTSGNTGIGFALLGALKGYKVIIVMPDSMSVERREIIKAYGAEIVLSPGSESMAGAIKVAKEIASKIEGSFIPQQFTNLSNAQKHYETTSNEIYKDLPSVDVFIAGVGTGGTITGVGRKLKEIKKDIKIIAIEPASSRVLSGGKPAPHKIQGIGANFIPDLYDSSVVDEVIAITDEEALTMTKRLLIEEGLFLGISSASNVVGALKIAKKLGKGKKVVTIAPDGGEKYLSTGVFA